jgi:protein O-GlcNAc transferase
MTAVLIDLKIRQAVEHHRAGQLAEAETLYRQALAMQPNHPDILHLLGVLVAQRGQPEAGLELLRRAVALNPRSADFHANLGAALVNTGHPQEAIDEFKRALELRPGHVDAGANLGLALKTQGRFDEAIEVFRKVIAARPDHAAAWRGLGDSFRITGQLEEAAEAFRREIALGAPNQHEAYNLLGVTLQVMERTGQSIEAFHKAIALRSDFADAYNNLATALQAQGSMQEAIEACRKAIAIRSDISGFYSNLANLLKDCDQLDEAISVYRRAIALNPSYVFPHDNLLFALYAHPDLDPAVVFQEHVAWDRQHAQPLEKQNQSHPNDRSPQRRLRIGYVSPDFRQHSVAFFLESLLGAHDPSQVEIFCYADLNKADSYTLRLQQLSHHWRLITGMSDVDVAALIRKDKIDILVDLAGHTSDNRLLVFARRPAPIQVTYLGYPGTTGMTAMDYRLTDAFADPPGTTEQFHTEKLVRLSHGFLCYRPPAGAPEIGPTPAQANGYVTFGSFNHLAKITNVTVQMWSQIMQRIPTSRLLIKSQGLNDPAWRATLADRFSRLGIQSDRIEMLAKIPSLSNHLQLYHRIDIALDPFPYHGTTTTLEAMWMGVPTVTLSGKTHASRVGVSLLSNAGVFELIGQSHAQYVQIAVDLAQDLPRLSELHSTLRKRLTESPLMDAKAFARDVESAYRQMWQAWTSN